MNNHFSVIMSVTDDHWEHARRNIHLMERTNPRVEIEWVVVANNHDPDFKIPQSVLDNQRVKIVEGFQYDKFQGFNRPPSYSLSFALQKALTFAAGRYVVQIDADYFIFQPSWMRRVRRAMDEQELAFFGAPWDPKRTTKWRDFPCSHFTVFDTEKVDKKLINFMPKYPPYFEVMGVHKWLRNELYRDFLVKRQDDIKQRIAIDKEQLNRLQSGLPQVPADNGIESRDIAMPLVPAHLIFSGSEEHVAMQHDYVSRFRERRLNILDQVQENFAPLSERQIIQEMLQAQAANLNTIIGNQSRFVSEHNLAVSDLDNILASSRHRLDIKLYLFLARGARRLAPKPYEVLFQKFVEYCELGETADCNVRIYHMARKQKLKSGMLRIATGLDNLHYPKSRPRKLWFWLKQMFHEVMPAKYRTKVLYRAPGTRLSFPEFGLPHFRQLGWEEYFWNGKPFAVHMRSTARRSNRFERLVNERLFYNFIDMADGQGIDKRNSFAPTPLPDVARAEDQPAPPSTSGLKKIAGTKKGKTAFVVANGPSLDIATLDLIAGYDTFACNKIYATFDQTAWRPSYYFCEDPMVLENINADIAKHIECPIFLPCSAGSKYRFNRSVTFYPTVRLDQDVDRQDLSPVLGAAMLAGTVTSTMLHFALHMGYDNIVIVGLDHHFDLSAERPLYPLSLKIGARMHPQELDLFLLRNRYVKLADLTSDDSDDKKLTYRGDYVRTRLADGVSYRIRQCTNDDVVWVRLKDGLVETLYRQSTDEDGSMEAVDTYDLSGILVVSKGGVNHFWKGYRKVNEVWGRPNMRLVEDGFRLMDRMAKASGARIINASTTTLCDIFERGDVRAFTEPS